MIGTNSSAAAIVPSGMITVAGGVLGMHYDAMIVGFICGVLALSFLESSADGWRGYLKIAASVGIAVILAGAGAPVVAALLVDHFKGLAQVSEVVRIFCAAVIGLSAQTVIPIGFTWLRNKYGSQKPSGNEAL